MDAPIQSGSNWKTQNWGGINHTANAGKNAAMKLVNPLVLQPLSSQYPTTESSNDPVNPIRATNNAAVHENPNIPFDIMAITAEPKKDASNPVMDTHPLFPAFTFFHVNNSTASPSNTPNSEANLSARSAATATAYDSGALNITNMNGANPFQNTLDTVLFSSKRPICLFFFSPVYVTMVEKNRNPNIRAKYS